MYNRLVHPPSMTQVRTAMPINSLSPRHLIYWLLFSTLLLPIISTAAEEPDFSKLQGLGSLEQHQVTLEHSGQQYYLFVRLPEDYRSDGRYPVVYLLDGGITFPMLAAYYRYLHLAGDLPEMIVVGISYGTADYRAGNNRSHDFTAPSDQAGHYGGAENFSKIFEQHFFPLIEQRYNTDPQRRIIFGQSLGGQFVLHALLTRPDLFWGYIASNPALHRNLPFFLDTPAEKSSAAEQPRVFVSSAEFDDPQFRSPARQWLDAYAERQPPWSLQTRILPGHNHFSAAPGAFRQGMLWLFQTDIQP